MERINDKPVKIGEKKTRYTFRVNDDPSNVDTMRVRLHSFLREFVDQPALLQCGPTYARKMAIFHDGERWVLSGEAEEDQTLGP